MDNWKKLLFGGVAIGILLMLVQHNLQIDSKIFQAGLLVLSIAIFICYFIYIRHSNVDEGKRVQAQGALMKEGRTEEALKDMEAMLEELNEKGKTESAARCRLNMTAAYHDLKQYDKAQEILESFREDEFKGLANMVYRLNRCACCFYLNQDEKGVALYEENRELFTEYNQHKRYGGTIAAVLMFYKIAQGKYDQAQELLENARKAWTDRRYQDDYDLVEAKLQHAMEQQDGCLPEASGEAGSAE